MKNFITALILGALCVPSFAAQSTPIEDLKQAASCKDFAAIPVPEAAKAGDKTNMNSVKFLADRKNVKSGKNGCTVTGQSGSIDSWACRNSDGKIRCYADVDVNGKSFRVYGGCVSSYSACWASGAGAVVSPCDSIADGGDVGNGQTGGGSTPDNPTENASGCTFLGQGGSAKSWFPCRNPEEGKFRCHADASINGEIVRIYGACAPMPSDCELVGPYAVKNPCP